MDELLFWHQRGHQGEPDEWDEMELRSWLQIRMGKAASELRQLNRETMVQQVTAELDRLYATYKPAFGCKFHRIDLVSAPRWVAASERSPIQGIRHPGIRAAGSLEREFNSMFNLSEAMSNVGKALPMGRSPENDLRQNLLTAAQVNIIQFELSKLCEVLIVEYQDIFYLNQFSMLKAWHIPLQLQLWLGVLWLGHELIDTPGFWIKKATAAVAAVNFSNLTAAFTAHHLHSWI